MPNLQRSLSKSAFQTQMKHRRRCQLHLSCLHILVFIMESSMLHLQWGPQGNSLGTTSFLFTPHREFNEARITFTSLPPYPSSIPIHLMPLTNNSWMVWSPLNHPLSIVLASSLPVQKLTMKVEWPSSCDQEWDNLLIYGHNNLSENVLSWIQRGATFIHFCLCDPMECHSFDCSSCVTQTW